MTTTYDETTDPVTPTTPTIKTTTTTTTIAETTTTTEEVTTRADSSQVSPVTHESSTDYSIDDGGSTLTTGAWVGIGVSIVVVVIAAIIVIVIFSRRKCCREKVKRMHRRRTNSRLENLNLPSHANMGGSSNVLPHPDDANLRPTPSNEREEVTQLQMENNNQTPRTRPGRDAPTGEPFIPRLRPTDAPPPPAHTGHKVPGYVSMNNNKSGSKSPPIVEETPAERKYFPGGVPPPPKKSLHPKPPPSGMGSSSESSAAPSAHSKGYINLGDDRDKHNPDIPEPDPDQPGEDYENQQAWIMQQEISNSTPNLHPVTSKKSSKERQTMDFTTGIVDGHLSSPGITSVPSPVSRKPIARTLPGNANVTPRQGNLDLKRQVPMAHSVDGSTSPGYQNIKDALDPGINNDYYNIMNDLSTAAPTAHALPVNHRYMNTKNN